MTKASESLYSFVRATLDGICDEMERTSIEIMEATPTLITLIVRVGENDLKFVKARLKEMKLIAISIAQRHKVIASLLLEEGQGD